MIQHYMSNARKKQRNKISKPMRAKEQWIQYLNKQENSRIFTKRETAELLEWSQQKISLLDLNKCIENKSWRHPIS